MHSLEFVGRPFRDYLATDPVEASARMLASMQASKETSPGDSAGDRRNGPETRRGCLFHQIEVNESGCQPQGCFGIFYNQKVVIVV